MKTQKAIKLLLSLAVVSSSIAGAMANDAVLNSDPIDINGYVQEHNLGLLPYILFRLPIKRPSTFFVFSLL